MKLLSPTTQTETPTRLYRGFATSVCRLVCGGPKKCMNHLAVIHGKRRLTSFSGLFACQPPPPPRGGQHWVPL